MNPTFAKTCSRCHVEFETTNQYAERCGSCRAQLVGNLIVLGDTFGREALAEWAVRRVEGKSTL